MKFFKRIKNVIRSKTNAAVSSLENNNKSESIDLALVDLNNLKADLSLQRREQKANNIMLEKRENSLKTKSGLLNDKAKYYIENNDDENAKKILRQKCIIDTEVNNIEKAIEEAKKIIEVLDSKIEEVSIKIGGLSIQRNNLQNRLQIINTKKKINDILFNNNFNDINNDIFDLENNIEKEELLLKFQDEENENIDINPLDDQVNQAFLNLKESLKN